MSRKNVHIFTSEVMISPVYVFCLSVNRITQWKDGRTRAHEETIRVWW